MKKVTLAASLLITAAFAASAPAQTQPGLPNAAPTAALIEGRNFPNLNARNLGERSYDVALPGPNATQFSFKLKGYVFGIKMVTAHYNGYTEGHRYAAYTDIKTSGLGALLKKMEIWAVSKGTFNANGLTPDFHVQQNMDGKERRVEMNYDNAVKAVDVNIIPTLGSQGVPPASPEQRYSADDTISAILALMMQGQKIDKPFCEGAIRVFDSKQYYDLRMERGGEGKERFDGEKHVTQVCKVFYEPINGFDPEDLPDSEEGSTPMKIEFIARPEIGLYVPLKFTYKISSIKAVIKLDEMSWIASGSNQIVIEED